MPVAAEVARALEAPLDTVWVEQLTLGEAEKRVGVAAEGGVTMFDRSSAGEVETHPDAVDATIIDADRRLSRRSDAWHRGSPRPSLRGRAVLLIGDLLVDEELAAAAACAVRDRGAASVTYASPFVRTDTAIVLNDWVDEIGCVEALPRETVTSDRCGDRAPISDEQIHTLLRENVLTRRRS